MSFRDDQLDAIYERTSGYCHICHKKVSRANYGTFGARGAWEVEHSRPRVAGGTDRGNNLYPACISCNRSKCDGNTRTARRRNGYSRAPLSRARRAKARTQNAIAGGILVGAIGAAVFGPPGALFGSILGTVIGHKQNPDDAR